MNNKDENRKLYGEFYKEINSRILSNIENYDKAILSLSVTILGLSIAFMKNVLSLEEAEGLRILQSSWFLLVLAIIATIFSFLSGNKANEKHLEFAEDYYLKDNDEAFDKKSTWTVITEWLNYSSGLSFILGIILIVIFVNINIDVKGVDMSQEKVERGNKPPPMQPKDSDGSKPLTEGTVPPKITPKPSKG